MPVECQRPEPIVHLDDLKSGDVVIVKRCRACGGNHVHMLGESPAVGLFFTSGTFHTSDTGTLDVRPAIAERRLYRAFPGSRLELSMLGEVPV